MNKQTQQASVQKGKTAANRVISPPLPTLQLASMPQPLMMGVIGQLRPQDILRLQRTVGNQAVQRLLNNQPSANPEAPTEPISESEDQEGELEEERVELDLDEDGETEPHTLSVDQETGQLMIHSDPETLEDFLKKYQKKLVAPNDKKLLSEIKALATTVHTGRYGTKYTNVKGFTKTKAPTSTQRSYVKPQLTFIGQKLQALSKAKHRPPSHKAQHLTEDIDGETFCKKIVMEPLSIIPRDDNVEGSAPHEETQLWRSLTNFAYYKRGHMLNDHLHGPGTNDNLVPISTAFNATMREGVEKAAKKAVNSQNKVVRFEAEALDWGQFPGAFGFPEEKKLPNKFHFKMQQMKKNMGASGALASDWVTNGPILFEDTPSHDKPNDVVPGVVAPTVKTFVPGFYFYPFGSIKSALPNYHLKGSFNINSLVDSDILAGLGIDDPKNLKHSRVDETVLTEYQLPVGYGIKKLPVKEIEHIYFNKILKYTIPSPSFVVYNLADETRLQKEYQDKLDRFKEEQKLLATKKLNEEEQRKLEQLRRENERKMEWEERKRREEETKQRQQQNNDYRHKLLGQIRTEVEKYLEEYGEPLEKKREEILYFANKTWKSDSDLINKDMNELLAPVRKNITLAVEECKNNKEEKVRFIEALTERFDKAIDEAYMPRLLSPKAQEEFRRHIALIYEKHEAYWQSKDLDYLKDWGIEKLWQSPQEKLNEFYGMAKKYDTQGQALEGAELIIDKRFYNMMQKLEPGTILELVPHPKGVTLGAYYYVRVLSGKYKDSEGEIRKTQVYLP